MFRTCDSKRAAYFRSPNLMAQIFITADTKGMSWKRLHPLNIQSGAILTPSSQYTEWRNTNFILSTYRVAHHTLHPLNTQSGETSNTHSMFNKSPYQVTFTPFYIFAWQSLNIRHIQHRQCPYNVTWRVRSRNHFFRGKAIVIRHYECTVLVIRQAKRICRVTLSSLAYLTLPYLSTLSH